MPYLGRKFAALFLAASCGFPAGAQKPPSRTSTTIVVPAVTKFSGTLLDLNGKPITNTTGVTFSLYKDAQGGAALWMETHNVTADRNGRYAVTLGSESAYGLPSELFALGEARWLGAQAEAQAEGPRTLLVSVPYAMKAADAETIGGLPASAFMRANSGTETAGGAGKSEQAQAASKAVKTAAPYGSPNYVPIWTGSNGSTTIGNSVLFQSAGGSVGIGTASPAAILDVNGGADVRNTLTLFPSTNSPALSLSGTGFGVTSTGIVNFVSGQTFPGAGTITGVAAGTGLTGGGSSGNVNVNVDESVVAFQSDLAKAVNTLSASITTAINTSETYTNTHALSLSGGTLVGIAKFAGPGNSDVYPGSGPSAFTVLGGTGNSGGGDAIFLEAGTGGKGAAGPLPGSGGYGGDVTIEGGIGGDADLGVGGNGGTVNIAAGIGGGGTDQGGGGAGGNLLLSAGQGGPNAYSGSSGPGGLIVLKPGAGGDANAQPGFTIISADSRNAVPSQLQMRGATNPNMQLLLGYNTAAGNGYGSIQAIDQGITQTALSLNPAGGAVLIGTNSGTGNPFVVAKGAGTAIADGWTTYSSRRWKTNIQTLRGAMDKVERLRGVSYDLKSNGKHEVGVIAEEVGAVVPEIVQWEKDGKEAAGVDYSRLTALLIEAVKEQQRQALEKDAKIARLTTDVRRLRKLNGQVALLQARLAKIERGQVVSSTAVAKATDRRGSEVAVGGRVVTEDTRVR